MLIFIPMSGFGDRYKRAGYSQPKPLIPVDGQPMIERVISCFPKDSDFLFAVNRQHAEQTELVAVASKLAPRSKTIVIEPHKDGPVQTVLAVAEHLPDEREVLLNYCDFGVDWSFEAFRSWLDACRWDGAMTAYRGFHPHSLGPQLYAYMRSEGDRVLEIREKHHFTPNKLEEYASSGLYYFRRGADLKRLSRELTESGERVNNEFYISTVMQKLIEAGGHVGVHPLKHFYQWGTPDDLRDYEGWATAMRGLDRHLASLTKAHSGASQVIPMAGRGQRFVDQGYADPKPLIETAGRPMIAQAMAFLPRPTERVLIAQKGHAEDERFLKVVKALKPAANVISLDKVTEGQACTAKIGAEKVNLDAPVLFAPCDTGYSYDLSTWLDMEQAVDADLIAWTARGHLPALWRPQMYGWLHAPEGVVKAVAVKKQVEGVPPAEQEVVTGTFWFKSARMFLEETEGMIADDDRVNGEFYIDTLVRRMMENGKRVRSFTVQKYIPWGTPEELKTFQYWNEVFRDGKPLGLKP